MWSKSPESHVSNDCFFRKKKNPTSGLLGLSSTSVLAPQGSFFFRQRNSRGELRQSATRLKKYCWRIIQACYNSTIREIWRKKKQKKTQKNSLFLEKTISFSRELTSTNPLGLCFFWWSAWRNFCWHAGLWCEVQVRVKACWHVVPEVNQTTSSCKLGI